MCELPCPCDFWIPVSDPVTVTVCSFMLLSLQCQAWLLYCPYLHCKLTKYVYALMCKCFLPSGYFLLEPWDLRTVTNTPHFGVTVTVRDPNHEVQHWQERFITKPGSHKHVLAGFCIQTKSKQGQNQSQPNVTQSVWLWMLQLHISILWTHSLGNLGLTLCFLLLRMCCLSALVNLVNLPSQLMLLVSTTSASKPTPLGFLYSLENGWWDLWTHTHTHKLFYTYILQ